MSKPDSTAKSKAKSAVLISGMHRSGTAAASRALSFLGYAQPRLLTEAGPGNPTGYWQPVRIVQVNEEMIAPLGWSWDHTPLLTQPSVTPQEAEADILAHLSQVWMDRAREAIRDSYRPDAARIVCKDPRISLFAPFWQAAFEAEGYAVQHVLAFRDPLEVAASLKRAFDLGRGPALRAWLAYNLRPLSMVGIAATLDYRDLAGAPAAAVNGLARSLGVSELDEAAASELEGFIERATPAETADDEADEGRLTPRLVRQTHELLKRWSPGDPAMERKANRLRGTLTDAQLLYGRVRRLPPLAEAPAVYRVEAKSPAPIAEGPRTVVLHYHLFKNAGTSVDVVLEANFGDAWREAEFPTARRRPNVDDIEQWLADNSDVRALSSHTALGPLPVVLDAAVMPVIFARHPIDRIRSAYEFERRQKAETRGARLAKTVDFAGYVSQRLARHDRQCRNFQTLRFATLGPAGGDERRRALAAAEDLPFVGLVEDFAASMIRLETYLQQRFPDFRAFGAKENVWREGKTLAARLDDARDELGDELWAELLAANADDLELFARVAARYSLTVEALLAR